MMTDAFLFNELFAAYVTFEKLLFEMECNVLFQFGFIWKLISVALFVKHFVFQPVFSIDLLLNSLRQLLHRHMPFSEWIAECNSRSSVKVNIFRHFAHWCSFFVAACEDVGWMRANELCCLHTRHSEGMYCCATNSINLIENYFCRSKRKIRHTTLFHFRDGIIEYFNFIGWHRLDLIRISTTWNRFIVILAYNMILVWMFVRRIGSILIRNVRAPINKRNSVSSGKRNRV